MEIDVNDLLGEDFFEETPIIPSESEDIEIEEDAPDPVVETKDVEELYGRLRMWHDNCRDLFIDLRTVNYKIFEEDTFLEFRDKAYYEPRLYFKTDPQDPKNAKIIHATKQLCKIIGIPYSFFADCRPTLKENIFRTWQSGLADNDKKAQNVLKIRESKSCTIIRAITTTNKSFIPLHELVNTIQTSLNVPVILSDVFGDEKDDLVFHARFLFEKEYNFNGPICIGFSITASELDACPLSIDVLLYNKVSKTYCIALYGGDSFMKSDYNNLQASMLKDLLPHMIERLEGETPEILAKLAQKQEKYDTSIFCPGSGNPCWIGSKGFRNIKENTN